MHQEKKGYEHKEISLFTLLLIFHYRIKTILIVTLLLCFVTVQGGRMIRIRKKNLDNIVNRSV